MNPNIMFKNVRGRIIPGRPCAVSVHAASLLSVPFHWEKHCSVSGCDKDSLNKINYDIG